VSSASGDGRGGCGRPHVGRLLEAMAFLNISLQMRNGWSWQASWKLIGPEGDASQASGSPDAGAPQHG